MELECQTEYVPELMTKEILDYVKEFTSKRPAIAAHVTFDICVEEDLEPLFFLAN